MKNLLETMSGLKDNRNGKVVTFDFDHTIVKSFLNKTIDGEFIKEFLDNWNVPVDGIERWLLDG